MRSKMERTPVVLSEHEHQGDCGDNIMMMISMIKATMTKLFRKILPPAKAPAKPKGEMSMVPLFSSVVSSWLMSMMVAPSPP